MSRDAGPRAAGAVAHTLAALVEAQSGEEQWTVGVHQLGDFAARVFLGLSNGSNAETERGMAVLRRVVAEYERPN